MARSQLALMIIAGLLYAAQALLSLRRFFRPGRAGALEKWGLLTVGFVLHGCFVVSRACQLRELPVATRLDSIALFLWFTGLVLVMAERPFRLGGLAPIIWPVYAACFASMLLLAGRQPMNHPDLERTLLLLHLIPTYAAYAGFAVAAGAGAAFLAQQKLLRGKGSGALWRKLPSLEKLDQLGGSAVSLGFMLLTVGLVVGAIWAERDSAPLGRRWYGDPKVLAGVVVWLVYGAVLHVRLFGRWRGKRAALLTIAGFVVALVTFAAAHAYPSTGARTPQVSARIYSRR